MISAGLQVLERVDIPTDRLSTTNYAQGPGILAETFEAFKDFRCEKSVGGSGCI